MFSKPAPVTEPAADVVIPSALIPLVVLELSLAAPVEWAAFLADRGMSIIIDDIGRPSIPRSDARQLLDEQRESELQRRERAAELERQAVEQDRVRRASLGQGVKVPDGLSYAEAIHQAELDSQAYQPRRRSLVEDLLSNGGITFHPIEHEAGGS